MNLLQVITLIVYIGSVASQINLKKGAPHVQLRNGLLAGSLRTSRAGKHYSSFEGIRYAEIRERFAPPESVSSEIWKGVKLATKPGSRCAQLSFFSKEFIGEEDCLYLNVHVPWGLGKELLPVMVFIHGGGYIDGEGDGYGPQYFMDEGVLLVTLNYRLGPLGFLSTGDDVIPGNMGLKDQVMGLKWVAENIGAFGGDSGRVTIFGESAGSSSVHLHMVSPMSKGLFHRAILQSGTASCLWAYKTAQRSKQDAIKLGELVNCPTKTSAELADCLKSVNAEDLVVAQGKFARWNRDPVIVFAPTIETSTSNAANSFLTERPETLIKRNEYSKVPIIAGVTSDEGLLFHSVEILRDNEITADLNSNWNKIAPITFYYEDAILKTDLDIVSEKIRKFYFDGELISQNTFQNLTNLYSDSIFIHGLAKDVLLLAKSADAYLYIFTFKGEFSVIQCFGENEILGVAHGDDLQYFFKTAEYNPKVEPTSSSPSRQFSENVVKLWASFARTGKPSDTWDSVQWNPISKNEAHGKSPLKFLELDTNLKIVQNPFQQRIEFWNAIFEEHGIQKLDQKSNSRDEF